MLLIKWSRGFLISLAKAQRREEKLNWESVKGVGAESSPRMNVEILIRFFP